MKFEWSNEIFAENLRWYMDEARKTQTEIAAVAGVSSPAVSDWLHAKKMPRMDKIERLASFFGIQKSDLLEKRVTEEDVKEAYEISFITRRAMSSEEYKNIALALTELDDAELETVGNLVLMMVQKGKDKK